MRDSNSREAPKVASAERDRTHTPKFKITQQKAAAVVREREKERAGERENVFQANVSRVEKCKNCEMRIALHFPQEVRGKKKEKEKKKKEKRKKGVSGMRKRSFSLTYFCFTV